jgi:cyclopropane-fatty-acyl-phospholipid synthase
MLKPEQIERNGKYESALDLTCRTRSVASAPGIPRSTAARELAEFLELADIRINGNRPWDLQVHDQRLYRRVISKGSLGAGESYVDGWWDAEALDEFFARIHLADPYEKLAKWRTVLLALSCRLFNHQSESTATQVADAHYDLGNDLYQAMLDRRMQYTCAYWPGARTLDEAQENKLRLICRKLYLEPGMTVLELGGGFGGLARFLAAEYGCQVVSYNISRRQVEFGREKCAGLPVRIEHKDYRQAAYEQMRFDRVVSIGLCEHIGYKNYRGFFDIARSRLNAGGLFLLHTIGGNHSETSTDPWINKYIFPNGMVPSLLQLAKAAERGWVMEDLHSFGPDYYKTLIAWWENFSRAWPSLASKYGDRFHRMWKYYLLSSAGTFKARKLQLWQMVLSKGDIPAYTPVR